MILRMKYENYSLIKVNFISRPNLYLVGTLNVNIGVVDKYFNMEDKKSACTRG